MNKFPKMYQTWTATRMYGLLKENEPCPLTITKWNPFSVCTWSVVLMQLQKLNLTLWSHAVLTNTIFWQILFYINLFFVLVGLFTLLYSGISGVSWQATQKVTQTQKKSKKINQHLLQFLSYICLPRIGLYIYLYIWTLQCHWT